MIYERPHCSSNNVAHCCQSVGEYFTDILSNRTPLIHLSFIWEGVWAEEAEIQEVKDSGIF